MKRALKIFVLIFAVLGIAYTSVWFYTGTQIKKAIIFEPQLSEAGQPLISFENQKASLSGFPKEFRLTWSGTIITPTHKIDIPKLTGKSWFAQGNPIRIQAPDGIKVSSAANEQPFEIERFDIVFTIPKNWPGFKAYKTDIGHWQSLNEQFTLDRFNMVMKDVGLTVSADGYMTLDKKLQPAGVVNVKLDDIRLIKDRVESIKTRLQNDKNLSKTEQKQLIQQMAVFSTLLQTSDEKHTIRVLDNSIRYSFFRLKQFPMIEWEEAKADTPTTLPTQN